MNAPHALVERLRAATEQSRELDWLIADATNHPSFKVRFEHMWPPFCPRSKLDRDIPSYTASVDSALALVERLLGHAARVDLSIEIGSVCHACSISLVEHEEPFVAENCRTPAIAVVLALLTALEAKSQEAVNE